MAKSVRDLRVVEGDTSSPTMIGFHELTEYEVFVTEAAARAGVTFANPSETEPLVTLGHFGPEANPDAPEIGAHRRSGDRT